jgi:hypothetical protein
MKLGPPRRDAAGRRLFVLEADDLPGLIEAAEILREDDTGLAGPIRVLRLDRRILVQEQEPRTSSVLVRELPSREAAERFVAERLDAYERMWDGCGCRIDYST